MGVMLYKIVKTNNQTHTNMKNHIRILNLFFLLTLISLSAFGQTEKDSTAVLQKCIELNDLQQYLPLNSDGAVRQLYLLQNNRVSFPAGTNVQVVGKKVKLVDNAQIEAIPDSYFFQFWDFRISQDKATVGFMFNIKDGINTTEMIRVVAAAEKKGAEWLIIDVKITKVR